MGISPQIILLLGIKFNKLGRKFITNYFSFLWKLTEIIYLNWCFDSKQKQKRRKPLRNNLKQKIALGYTSYLVEVGKLI